LAVIYSLPWFDIKAAIGLALHNDLGGFLRGRNTTGKVVAVEQICKKSRGLRRKVGEVYPVTAVSIRQKWVLPRTSGLKAQSDTPIRSEVIRRLVEIGRKAKGR
jgi:predicted transcriptional regulator